MSSVRSFTKSAARFWMERNMRDAIYKMITDIVDNAVDMCFSDDVDSEEWDLNEFNGVLPSDHPNRAAYCREGIRP